MSARSAAPSVPPVLLGTIGGAIAAIPVVPLVRELALRLGSVPGIPGAENAARDVKGATFAEIAAIVVAIPAFSFFFGRALPGFLERRARPGRLSFQWAGAAAALASWLWKRGVVPAVAIPSGIVLGLLAAGFVLAFRNRFAVRRLLSRRHRWRIAAIGGTGAAWELARLSNPGGARPIARNPILDLAIAAAVALIAGAFLARIRGRFAAGLERTAAACGLSLPLAAIAIAFPRTLPFALAAAAGVFLVSSWIGLSGRPRLLVAGALLVLGACGWTTYYQPYSPVNLFEDGHALGFATAYLSGAAPFRDTYPIHGWGVDGGVDALAFRWASATLEVFRIRRAAFTALALPALAAASVAALGSLGWGTAALVLFLATCPFVSERSLFAIVALGFLAAGVRRERARYLVLAGVFAAAGIFFALDMGIIVLAGGIVGLGLVAVSLRRAAPVVGFLSGAVIGAIPFLGILAGHGSLAAFFRLSFREIPHDVLAAWGLPMAQVLPAPPSIRGVVESLRGNPAPAAFLVVLSSVCVIVLLFRIPWTRGDLVIVPPLAVAVFALRGVAGRAEPAHYALYGAFAGLPAAWLLRRAAEASWARAAAALAFLCLGFHPRSGIENVLTVVTSASRARAERAAEMKPIPLGGGALVPAVQAEDLAALKSAFDRVMGPGDTFFDFSNEPALYFLLDRRMPVPFLGPEFYESEGAQRRVIALCERERPLVAIARAGNGLDAIDGVANEIRAPIVAGYLKEKYRPFAVVGGREVLIRADRRAR